MAASMSAKERLAEELNRPQEELVAKRSPESWENDQERIRALEVRIGELQRERDGFQNAYWKLRTDLFDLLDGDGR